MSEKKQLRILYLQTFPLYGSGSGTYARYLAREVANHHEVAIVCPDKRRMKYVKSYGLRMPFHVAFTGHPEWKNSKLYSELSNLEILKVHKYFLDSCIEAVEDFKPNILHVHHAYPLSWSARFIKSIYNIPYVITIHGSELPTAQKDTRYVALTTDALRKAVKIVPNSYYTKEWALSIFRDNYREKVRVIPGGVDVRKFRKRESQVDDEFGLSGKRVVMFAGKLTKYKGVEYLVKAAEKIKGEVLIIGDGSDKARLKEIAKKKRLQNVHFISHLGNRVRRLTEFYSRADVFVAPSVWDEPLGLVVLESMACETPVVVTRKGGIPLAVKDGKNGLFIKPRNSADIVEKVNYLLANDEKRKRMGKTAREIAKQRFSWEIIAQRFMKIYEQYANV